MLNKSTCCFGKQRFDGNTQFPNQLYTDRETETMIPVQLDCNSNKQCLMTYIESD